MKLLVTIFFAISTFAVFSQHNWDSKNWDKGSIGFGCGFAGSMTKAVANVTDLLVDQDYEEIRELLNSKKADYQFISVLTLEQLSEKKEIILTSNEIQRISLLKISERLVPICSGCTYWDEQPLAILFDKKNRHLMYNAGEYWFKVYYKQPKRD